MIHSLNGLLSPSGKKQFLVNENVLISFDIGKDNITYTADFDGKVVTETEVEELAQELFEMIEDGKCG